MKLKMLKKREFFLVLILLISLFLVSSCNPQNLELTENFSEVESEELQIIIKDLGIPNVFYLQPTIKEIMLQNSAGEWITIWNDATGKSIKLTPDGAETTLDFKSVPAGTYTGTKVFVSTMEVGVDINKDGDISDVNQEIILTLDEFNKLPAPEKPTAPSAPTKPEQPQAPLSPEKPAEPQQPSAPEKPQQPEDLTGAVITNEKPAEPEQPSEPERPPEPEKPSSPQQPSEPEQPSAPQEPQVPYRIENNIVYTGTFMDEVHTETINNYIFPEWENDFIYSGKGGKIIYDFTLSPLLPKGKQISVNISASNPPRMISTAPLICKGTCASSSQPCPAGMTSKGTTGCTAQQICSKCGFWGTRKCCTPVPQICCEPIPSNLQISSITLSPISVVNGDQSTATITLSGPAPSRGQILTISSTGTPLNIPKQITINPGATSTTFNVRTYQVNSISTANITASIESSQKSALFTVNPSPTISAIVLKPNSIVGGNKVIGTVILNGPAPNLGRAVQILAVNKPYISMPYQVVVAPGAKEANFTISTTSVKYHSSATITAVLNRVRVSAGLSVIPKR